MNAVGRRLRRLQPPLRGKSNSLLDSRCSSPIDFREFIRSQIVLIGLFFILYNVHEKLPPHNSNHSSPGTFYFYAYKTFGLFFCLTVGGTDNIFNKTMT